MRVPGNDESIHPATIRERPVRLNPFGTIQQALDDERAQVEQEIRELRQILTRSRTRATRRTRRRRDD